MNILNNTIPKLLLAFILLFSGSFAVAQTQPSEDPSDQEPLLEVLVTWDRSSTEVVPASTPYVRFESDGLVERSKAQTVYLTITSMDSGTATPVCTFGPDAGSRFSVSYPACATGNQNVPQTINGSLVLLPQNQYHVTFTDESGNVVNSSAGDGSYLLPTIPAPSLPNNLLEVESTLRSHPDGGEYYLITVDVGQTIPGESLELFLRTIQNAEPVEIPLGTISVTSGTVTLPETIPAQGLSDGSYELVAQYNGINYQIIGLDQRIGGDTTRSRPASSDSAATGGMFNSTQKDILANGLVPDCGYDIRTLSNKEGAGRMCGLTDAITLIQRLIEYIFILILPIAAIVFVYVGYLFLTSGGNPDKRSTAKKAMLNLVIGIVIIMAAWLIVKTILLSLGVDDTGIPDQFLDLST